MMGYAAADAEAWLLTNPTEHDITEVVNVTGWGSVTDLLDASFRQEGKRVILDVQALDMRVFSYVIQTNPLTDEVDMVHLNYNKSSQSR